MLNYIWLALVLLAVAIGGWNDRLKDVTGGALDGAKTAVTIALGLWGVMALWLGVMRLAERAGLVQRTMKRVRGWARGEQRASQESYVRIDQRDAPSVLGSGQRSRRLSRLDRQGVMPQ